MIREYENSATSSALVHTPLIESRIQSMMLLVAPAPASSSKLSRINACRESGEPQQR